MNHRMGRAKSQFFLPCPLGPRGGAKRSNIIKTLSNLGGTGVLGVKKIFFFNQIWCVSYSYEQHTATAQLFLVPTPWGLREGPKGQISLNFNYKVNLKDF